MHQQSNAGAWSRFLGPPSDKSLDKPAVTRTIDNLFTGHERPFHLL